MTPGTSVRLTSDPGRQGITTGKSRSRGGRLFWQVKFTDGSQYIPEKQLETFSEGDEDALDLFAQGKFGRARDLRDAITHIRLSGRLADLIYSMETTHTDFYPYQFKPVLNFLDSPSGGILIADEVGLGKTIEAGLIWTELRSRYDARRLMVLCPAMLQEKWKFELQRRFGLSPEVANAARVLEVLDEYRDGKLNEFTLVASMQGLRPNHGWEDDAEVANRASTKLARFLEENAHDESLLDLLIVDEAHYLRNPHSMTFRLGRLLRPVADHVALLSATPIHLKNQDLYQLLNIVDEDAFNQIHVFDDILRANAPLIRARDLMLQNHVDAFLEQLAEAQSHELLRDNRQIQTILDNPPTIKDLESNAYKSELAHRLESINLLGHAVTRTRKRDVTEWRVVRHAASEVVTLSKPELEFYAQVTDLVREYCLERDAHEGFLLVTPQRQISSSMPAALREWQKRGLQFDQAFEDIGESPEGDEDIGPLVRTISQNAHNLGNLQELWENDSKYHRLSMQLKRYLKDHPKEKIVLFAYFKPTLYYLYERLKEEGINSVVLVGGGKVDKYEVMERFKNPKGPNVLLASEVASEGVDLQFSRVLINYDLPWNPMKVEQRIGRIDRIGQSSPTITIWNLFYADTIDARIYTRLYMRLGIFEYALGGLEAVLGEEIQRLTIDLMSGKLTPVQEEDRIAQTEQAISNLRKQEETLEQNANNLIAHGDYILNQVRAAKELGRCIGGEDLSIYIRDFFDANYPGCEFQQLKPDELVFDVRLSEEARFHFVRFLKSSRLESATRMAQYTYKPFRCEFRNQVPEKKRAKHEFINQFHPLTRFVSASVKDKIAQSEIAHYPTVGLRLNRKETPAIKPGDYLFYVARWAVQGIKDIERLVYFARLADPPHEFLNREEAEQLVTSAAKAGGDWLSVANEVDVEMLMPFVEECMDAAEQRYSDYISALENENNDRADLQEKTLRLHMTRQREKLQAVLDRHQEKGNLKMIAPTKGKIEKMETRVRDKLRVIEEKRMLAHHNRDVCLGVIRVE